jgi:hypothetical protein
MATAATAPPRTDVIETDEDTRIVMEPQSGVGRKRRASRRRGGFRTQDVNSASPVPAVGPQGPLGGRRRTRKHKGKKRHTRRRRGGNTPLPSTKMCDYDSKCSHSNNGKHDWGLVGRGNYVCQNKCGCAFDDR